MLISLSNSHWGPGACFSTRESVVSDVNFLYVVTIPNVLHVIWCVYVVWERVAGISWSCLLCVHLHYVCQCAALLSRLVDRNSKLFLTSVVLMYFEGLCGLGYALTLSLVKGLKENGQTVHPVVLCV